MNTWCTLVMLNDNYACGAVVVARSLRALGTKYPIACMVAKEPTGEHKGVSDECVEFLRKHFDTIHFVPTITANCIPMKSKKQNEIYGSWINAAFTKGNILNLPYDKVCFVDADMLFVENCDDLFDLPAPAMTFSSPWAIPYHHGKGSRGHYNPYLKITKELEHGEMVPFGMIKRGLGSIVGLACMILVEPKQATFDLFMKQLDTEAFGYEKCISGFDEQAFAATFLATGAPIYNIHQQYNWVVGKTHWLKEGVAPKTYQWYNGKPWNQTGWDDLIPWWKIANELIDQDPTAAKWFGK